MGATSVEGIIRTRWSDEEKEFILANADKMSDIEIGEALNRSPLGVRDTRKRLGLESWFVTCRRQGKPIERAKRQPEPDGLSVDAARANAMGLHYGEYMFKKENGLL